MKKILSMAVLLSALIMGVNSCSREESLHEKTSGNSITLQLNGDVRTYASPVNMNAPSATAALDREKKINTAHVVLFEKNDANEYKYYGMFKGVSQSGNKYKFDVLKAGTFKMIVAANPDSDLERKIKGLSEGTSGIEDFGKLVASQTPGENKDASNFLMLSELSGEITTQASSSTPGGTINVKRASARFDVYNTVQGLSMTKLTFKQRVTNTRLAPQSNTDNLTFTDDKTYMSSEGLNARECVAAIYSYEHPTSGQCKLVLEGTYNGKAINPYEIVINTEVKRNHLYSIVISPEGNQVTPGTEVLKLKADIIVRDWNEAEVINWTGESLADKSAAEKYTVSGTHISNGSDMEAAQPLENPTTVTMLGYMTSTLNIKVESASAGSNLVFGNGDISGAKIESGNVTVENDKLVQNFTVTFDENLEKSKNYKLEIVNGFAPDAKKEITVTRKGYKDPHPKLSIEYVAEYDISKAPKVFATEHKNTGSSGHYTWNNAMKAIPEGYHMPSSEEWQGIVPGLNHIDGIKIDFINSSDYKNFIEKSVKVGNKIGNYKSDIKNTGNGITYAIRFKDDKNDMRSAWRYHAVREPKGQEHVTITVRYIGPSSITIDDISDEDWWKQNSGLNIVRKFPVCGFYGDDGTFYWGINGTGSVYWSSTANGSDVRYTDIYLESLAIKYTVKTAKFSVRPFSNE